MQREDIMMEFFMHTRVQSLKKHLIEKLSMAVRMDLLLLEGSIINIDTRGSGNFEEIAM